jgi:hypothetical protein
VRDGPLDLLAAARGLLTVPDKDTIGLWPRASALLGRQALESSLERFWRRFANGLQATPMRCQLLSLPTFIGDAELARRASHAWWALSRASHHQAYDLGPTHEELDGWLTDVGDLANAIETLCARRGAAPSTSRRGPPDGRATPPRLRPS